MKLVYKNAGGTQQRTITASGTDKFKTSTFFVNVLFDATGFGFDFELQSEEQVPVSFVRVIKTDNNDTSNQIIKTDDEISAFPNPFINYLKLESHNQLNIDYTIFDIMGRIVEKEKINNLSVINTSGWKQGIYFFKIEGFNTKKLIKIN